MLKFNFNINENVYFEMNTVLAGDRDTSFTRISLGDCIPPFIADNDPSVALVSNGSRESPYIFELVVNDQLLAGKTKSTKISDEKVFC